jgi:hypothetical protein
MSPNQIQPRGSETKLEHLGLPFIDVLLTERFLLPPDLLRRAGEEVPTTVGDLERLSGMPIQDIFAIIDECKELSLDLWLSTADLETIDNKEGTVILDMRPHVTFETDPLHPSARLFHLQNPGTLLPFLKTCTQVIVLSSTAEHAWSAAISLRKMGINALLIKSS